MLMIFLVLVATLLTWWGGLWLAPLPWQHFSPSAMLLSYIAPPILATTLYALWQRHRTQKQAKAEEERQQRELQLRQAEQQAARSQHEAQKQTRQENVECRGVWAQGLSATPAPWIEQEINGCQWRVLRTEDLLPGEIRAGLSSPLSELLQSIYSDAPGVAGLPLYIEPLPELAGAEQLEWIGGIQRQAALGLADEFKAPCRFMPSHGALGDRLLQILRQTPDLPGLLVLALDAPWLRQRADTPYPAPSRNTPGPGAALVAMVFLRAHLPLPREVSLISDEADAYQPYWQRRPTVDNASWGMVAPAAQPSLLALPRLAVLCQASEALSARGGALSMSKTIGTLLDRALVNADLRDDPFSAEERRPEKDQAQTLGWLVHNSGPIESGGARLAALCNSLGATEIDLSPVEQASNLLLEWGDVGVATPTLLAALAISHSARLKAPVLMTRFDQQHVSLALARPAIEEQPA